MKLDIVPLSTIDFKDNTFLIRPGVGMPLLLNSVKDVGIINQPILRKKNDLYQIISGHKRLEACRELGIAEILSKIYKSNEITDVECLKIVFYENHGSFGDIERGELLLKFKILCNLKENELNQRVLPFLGIPPSRRNFEKYMRLGELEREIKDAFYSQKITVEQAVILSESSSSSRIEILNRVLLKLKMNTNETRGVVKEINEIAVRDKKGVKEVIDDILLRIDKGDLKADSFRRELKLMRYPVLTTAEEEFNLCLKALNLPKDVATHHPLFFEGNHIEIRMRITSAKRLSEILSYLSSVLHNGLMNRLLA
ncbi:MAG: ParB/RepB/Spo0J family partition protein [Candidatus Dadabacteria bacterium]|nr:ParB/RepB/Spo0J family partition protein [Candidatus Dadabacteria bacterium]